MGCDYFTPSLYRVLHNAILTTLLAVGPTSIDAFALDLEVPILVYHRFAPRVNDSMTVRTATFEDQLQTLEHGGYHVIPLRQLVDYLLAKGPAPPPRSVVITVDDGHRSVYTELFPIVLRHRIPVTLFIYPSAISNAPYALTWPQLRELRKTGLFEVQSHTYWHPNFMREKRRLDHQAYAEFVDMQLSKSKRILESQLGGQVSLLAWPFGLHDEKLEVHARKAGYMAAFTIERRPVRTGENPMAIPRYLITSAVTQSAFDAILGLPSANASRGPK